MTRVLFRTLGVPTPGDPMGVAPGADPTPTLVPAELIAANGDGTFRVRIGSVTIEDVTEGPEPRQWQRVSRAQRSELEQLRADIAGLMSDADPNVRMAARSVAAALQRHQVRQVLADLRQAALNTQLAGTTRAQALTMLGLILAEERD